MGGSWWGSDEARVGRAGGISRAALGESDMAGWRRWAANLLLTRRLGAGLGMKLLDAHTGLWACWHTEAEPRRQSLEAEGGRGGDGHRGWAGVKGVDGGAEERGPRAWSRWWAGAWVGGCEHLCQGCWVESLTWELETRGPGPGMTRGHQLWRCWEKEMLMARASEGSDVMYQQWSFALDGLNVGWGKDGVEDSAPGFMNDTFSCGACAVKGREVSWWFVCGNARWLLLAAGTANYLARCSGLVEVYLKQLERLPAQRTSWYKTAVDTTHCRVVADSTISWFEFTNFF